MRILDVADKERSEKMIPGTEKEVLVRILDVADKERSLEMMTQETGKEASAKAEEDPGKETSETMTQEKEREVWARVEQVLEREREGLLRIPETEKGVSARSGNLLDEPETPTTLEMEKEVSERAVVDSLRSKSETKKLSQTKTSQAPHTPKSKEKGSRAQDEAQHLQEKPTSRQWRTDSKRRRIRSNQTHPSRESQITTKTGKLALKTHPERAKADRG